MSEGLNPIPTRWCGYFFRSRLEARWAVFFSHLEIEFWYEPEGYDLDGVRYLPDFFLPLVRLYAEVKPRRLDSHEMCKAERLCIASGFQTILLVGPPDFRTYDCIYMDSAGLPTRTDVSLDVDAYGRKYYHAEGRLFACIHDISTPLPEEQFTQKYIDAVYKSREERFEGAA